MAKKKQYRKKEIATKNIRIYESSLVTIRPLAEAEGKTIPRIIDEKFNPEKYGKQ